MDKHLKELGIVQKSIDTDFEGATNIPKTGRTSLYQTIINNNHTRSQLRRKFLASPTHSQGNQSPTSYQSATSRKAGMGWSKARRSGKWREDGAISSS